MTEQRAPARIPWVDACKGITFLLVIIGHTLYYLSERTLIFLYSFLYSFHMPLFFMLSAYTFRFSANGRSWLHRVKKSFFQMVVPAVLVMVAARTLFRFMNGTDVFALEYWKQIARTVLFANGIVGTFHGIVVEPMGMFWFLFVLFTARALFDGLHLLLRGNRGMLYAVCLLLGVVGVLLRNRVFFFTETIGDVVDGLLVPKYEAWPFCFDLSLSVLPYFVIGNVLRQKPALFEKGKRTATLLASAAVFAVSFALVWHFSITKGENCDVVKRGYPLFPLCYVMAAAGALAVMTLCACWKNGNSMRAAAWLGTNTLLLLMIHNSDYLWDFVWSQNTRLAMVYRIAIDVLLLWLCLSVKNKLWPWLCGKCRRQPQTGS